MSNDIAVIDAGRVREGLPFRALLESLREAFVSGAVVPLRHAHRLPAGTSLLMPAWDDAGFYGVKIVNIHPDNVRLGLPGLHSSYVLHDAATGRPLALLDGNEITSRRTAAVAALAASFLARPDAERLVVIGTGRVGSLIPAAMASVRRLRRVAIWGRQPEVAARCADGLRRQGLPAEAVTDLEAAVRAADIVSCATLATRPVVRAAWLSPGSHLDLIGSFSPQMIEAEPACFAGASVWVDTDEAMAKAGDLIEAVAAGSFAPRDLRGDLTGLCRGMVPGRRDAAERTLFKSVGTALADLAAARLVWRGIGATAAAIPPA